MLRIRMHVTTDVGAYVKNDPAKRVRAFRAEPEPISEIKSIGFLNLAHLSYQVYIF